MSIGQHLSRIAQHHRWFATLVTLPLWFACQQARAQVAVNSPELHAAISGSIAPQTTTLGFNGQPGTDTQAITDVPYENTIFVNGYDFENYGQVDGDLVNGALGTQAGAWGPFTYLTNPVDGNSALALVADPNNPQQCFSVDQITVGVAFSGTDNTILQVQAISYDDQFLGVENFDVGGSFTTLTLSPAIFGNVATLLLTSADGDSFSVALGSAVVGNPIVSVPEPAPLALLLLV